MKLCTSAQMRALEQAAVAAGTSLDDLMEAAGLAVAQEVWLSLGVVAERRVLVLVGPGNNGGDGLVAARHLADWDADVCVYLLRARERDKNLDLLTERNITMFTAEDDTNSAHLADALDGAEVVVDALLGIGTSRPVKGALAEILRCLHARTESARGPRVVAVDLPTGVDADTGIADPLAVTADLTVTFGVAKVGLYTLAGAEHAGRIEVVDIGLPKDAERDLPVELLTTSWVRDRLPKRPKSANKGTFGKVLVIAGSQNYVGAVRLTAEAAYRAGAGLVTIAATSAVQSMIASSLPEATWLPLPEEDGAIASGTTAVLLGAVSDYNVVVLGPGLSRGGAVDAVVPALLRELPANVVGAVVDADGLNALAAQSGWHEAVHSPLILTPHPGEMARLLGSSVEAVQSNRLKTAVDAAAKFGQTIVLKGAHTIVAAPDGRVAISPHANALLAVAGTGDVLAGTIGGLLAQGMDPFDAAACGVFVHGFAGEEMAEEMGDRGLLASELLPAIPRAIQTILQGKKPSGGAASRFGGLGDLAGLGGATGGPADLSSLLQQ